MLKYEIRIYLHSVKIDGDNADAGAEDGDDNDQNDRENDEDDSDDKDGRLHNPSVKNKPSVDQFISMNRGINNDGDPLRELLAVGISFSSFSQKFS